MDINPLKKTIQPLDSNPAEINAALEEVKPAQPLVAETVIQPLNPPAPTETVAQPTSVQPVAPTEPIAYVNPSPIQPEAPKVNVSQVYLTPKNQRPTYGNSQVEKQEAAPELKELNSNDSNHIVFQWLTYIFWSLTIFAASILTGIITSYFITQFNAGLSILYSVAAVLVFLPAAVFCDRYYSKSEALLKTGFSAVIMVISAVGFATFALAALAVVAFSVVSLIINGFDNSQLVFIQMLTAIVIALLNATAFLRTIWPQKILEIRRYYTIFMLAAMGILCALALFGPVLDYKLSQKDSLVESNIQEIATAVGTYTKSNNKLPDDLSSVTLNGDAKKVVTDKSVTYVKETTEAGSYEFKYQLCTEYRKASSSIYGSVSAADLTTTSYDSYPSPVHPAGKYCYKLSISDYSSMYQSSSSDDSY